MSRMRTSTYVGLKRYFWASDRGEVQGCLSDGGRPGNTARDFSDNVYEYYAGRSGGAVGEKKSVVQKRAQDVLVGKIFRRGGRKRDGVHVAQRFLSGTMRCCSAGRSTEAKSLCNNGRSPEGERPGGEEDARKHTSGASGENSGIKL